MSVREYELIYIARPDLTDEDLEVISKRTESNITDQGGHVLKIDDWGKKKLAYEIQRFSKGHYTLFNYLGGADAVNEVERILKIDDSVLRFLHVKLQDRVDAEARIAEAKEEAEKIALLRQQSEGEAVANGAASA